MNPRIFWRCTKCFRNYHGLVTSTVSKLPNCAVFMSLKLDLLWVVCANVDQNLIADQRNFMAQIFTKS